MTVFAPAALGSATGVAWGAFARFAGRGQGRRCNLDCWRVSAEAWPPRRGRSSSVMHVRASPYRFAATPVGSSRSCSARLLWSSGAASRAVGRGPCP